MVLVWPDKLARLSLGSSSEDVATNTSTATVIIIGFLDATDDSSVIIGAISSSDPNVKVDLIKNVTSAIDQLRHPCNDFMEYTIIYQSLRIIAVFDESSAAQGNLEKHAEIIIYNTDEANSWNTRCSQFIRQKIEVGALQKNLIRMGKSKSVFEELSSCLKDDNLGDYLQRRIQNTRSSTTSTIKIQKAYHNEPNYNYAGKQSLLLLHWTSMNKKKNTIIENQIPLVCWLKLLKKGRRHSPSFTAIIFDSVIGFLIGYCLFQYPTQIIQQLSRAMEYHDHFFNNNLQWLQSFPAGFKLNVALTHRVGKEVRCLLFYRHRLHPSIAAVSTHLFGETITNEALLQCIGLSTVLFGSRFFFALLFDMTHLALLHIHLLSEVFASCLRYEMSAMKSFWLLFTGKKRNVLRQRSDHLHYDHMQLLLGMLLFSTSLFLFTTILVYHWFFAVTNFGAELICGTIWCLHVIMEGAIQYERIILRRRISRNNGTWNGNEVQFVPVSLSKMISGVDRDYVMQFCDEGLERKQVKRTILSSNVSTVIQDVCIMKVEFQSESDFDIALSALLSTIAMTLSRLPPILKRLLFGSKCCNLAHSLVQFTSSLIKDNK